MTAADKKGLETLSIIGRAILNNERLKTQAMLIDLAFPENKSQVDSVPETEQNKKYAVFNMSIADKPISPWTYCKSYSDYEELVLDGWTFDKQLYV